MKKTIAVILSLVLLLSMVAACGRGESASPPPLPTPPDFEQIETTTHHFVPLSVTDPIALATTTLTFADHNIPAELMIPRSGYVLAPTMYGLTGIDTISSFYFIAPYEPRYDPSISIDGQAPPHIYRESATTFLITPAVPLSANSVYIFRLSRDGFFDVTWAFQTTVQFELTSTMPRNMATNVPVRTGIEFSFSADGETNIEDHFSIYPTVEGRFIHRDNSAVFMPTNALAFQTIYTVTLSPGISTFGASDAINTSYSFAFETEMAPERANRQSWNHSIHFSRQYVEFPSFAEPIISFWLSYDRNDRRPRVDIGVYRFDDLTEAIAATNRIATVPFWAHTSREDRFVDVSNMTQVYSARINNRLGEHRWNEIFSMSSTLSPGFYVLNATAGDAVDQVIIQITDVAVQVVADDNRALVWINDMHTGLSPAAQVYDPITSKTVSSSSYGIAIVERKVMEGEYVIISANGAESVVFINSSAFQHFNNWHGGWGWEWDLWDMPISRSFGGWMPSPSSMGHNQYWTALQLDRTLFQRSDTVNLWGFVQNRRVEENIPFVTVTITEHAWWHSPDRDILHRQNIPVQYGAYSGEIRLPHLDPGFYEIAVTHGDITLNSMFFNVQDYAKPPYQLTATVDKDAVFVGEQVTFTARVEFFEGTPVPDLQLSYWTHGHHINHGSHGNLTTNISGNATHVVTTEITYAQAQGESHLSFSVEATLPEIGWVQQHAFSRVFINDIHVRPRATRDGRSALLTVNVHDITLDRLNNGTAEHHFDFLCEPTVGQRLNVDIYRIYWVRVRDGERYCFINRQVVPRYRYDRREQRLESFILTTDSYGDASRSFQVPDRRNESYEARITTTDGNGRTIRHNTFIGRDWFWFHETAGDGEPFLYGARPRNEGYDIGDQVELVVKSGTEPLERGNFLFIIVQDGILSYQVGSNSIDFIFDEQHVPNTSVIAYHFNGHTYHTSGQMTQRLHFNSNTRQMLLDIQMCADNYQPGDTATISIIATDQYGTPKAANINISLVDEALFALMDYNVDTLAELYRQVGDRPRFSLATHRTFVSDGIDDDSWSNGATRQYAAMADAAPALTAEASFDAEAGGGSNDTRIRERFEDTAQFKSLRTNQQGIATFTFELPDNITSWRLTASGISTDLYAGNTVQAVRVTNPMFIHYTFNSLFLTGDVPYIGVNAFGTSLTGGEQVLFEVWCESNPTDVRTATGTAFARVNIPLWEMTEQGEHALVIRATVQGVYSDAVRHSYTVATSHRQVEIAQFYDVATDTVFETNATGLTNITFTDHGRGQFLSSLMNMRWQRGARIEGLVAKREATSLIQEHFPDVRLFGGSAAFDIAEYQVENGGIAFLPYANANLRTTVLLLPFVIDEVNQPALRRYLYGVVAGTSQENRNLALYGLALMGEPVLLDLQRNAMAHNLSVRDASYIALGLAALGETTAAQDLYNRHIAPNIQRVSPYYRVQVGTTRADIVDATSIVALLAAKLNLPQSIGLHNYVVRHHGCTFALRLETLAFISHEINNHNELPASITYSLFGEEVTRDLSGWKNFTLRIPAANMHEFELIDVTGDVGAVSIVRTPLEEVEAVDNGITISRRFLRAGSNVAATSFAQDEVVRVEITLNYPAQSVSGSYVITDILPAGLRLVENSARFGTRSSVSQHWRHATQDGQRVTFFDWNGRNTGTHTYYYYARVINPGTFRAEGVMVQSFGVREYLSVGSDSVLTIRP